MTKRVGTFRKKPVEIQAYRCHERLKIKTLEGTMTANPGDWVVRGVKGELYPCRDDIFRSTYEPVDETAQQEWDEQRSRVP